VRDSELTACAVVSTWPGLAIATRRAHTLTVSPNTSPPLSTTGPKLKATLTASWPGTRGAIWLVVVCIAQAARNALSAEANWHTMPSPSVLTTMPLAAATLVVKAPNSRLITASACSSPSVS